MNSTVIRKPAKKGYPQEDVQVKRAKYIDGYRLSIVFTDGKESVVDFSDFLFYRTNKYLAKYKKPEKFKDFKVERGNVVWGADWDLIFPIHQLYIGQIQ